MSRLYRQIIPIAILVLGCWASPAQAFFEMSFEVDRNDVTIGDEITLEIEIVHGGNFELLPLPANLNIKPFEIKRVEALAPKSTSDGIREGFHIVMTIFELGQLEIPPVTIRFRQREQDGQVLTEAIPIRVTSVGRTAEDQDDIRNIKSTLSIRGIAGLSPLTMIGIGLALFLLLLAFVVLLRWLLYIRKRQPVDPDSLLSPPERALKRLRRLEESRYLQSGQIKAYFVELSYILEYYLIEQFQVISEDQTTLEILQAVKKSSFDPKVQSGIKEVFTLSDLAKFAKWVPAEDESKEALYKVRDMVRRTQPTKVEAKAATGES